MKNKLRNIGSECDNYSCLQLDYANKWSPRSDATLECVVWAGLHFFATASDPNI